MASNSNVDDASVPAPKRTHDSNGDDANDQKEKIMQALKENPASAALVFSKLLSCDACKFLARAPIRSCGLHHTICSICFEEHLGQNDCPAKGCKKKLMFKTVDSELTEPNALLRAVRKI